MLSADNFLVFRKALNGAQRAHNFLLSDLYDSCVDGVNRDISTMYSSFEHIEIAKYFFNCADDLGKARMIEIKEFIQATAAATAALEDVER